MIQASAVFIATYNTYKPECVATYNWHSVCLLNPSILPCSNNGEKCLHYIQWSTNYYMATWFISLFSVMVMWSNSHCLKMEDQI